MKSIAWSRRDLLRRVGATALLTAGAMMLTGCGAFIADHTPTIAGGLPEAAPARPETPVAYPAVHDLPPKREGTVLTDAEQKKLEDELIAARNRTTAASAKPAGSAGDP
jgi:hypothetical protein